MKQKKAQNLHSELNFVASIELEQSLMIISGLADTYPVTLTERNYDRTDFEVEFRHGTVKGTLQRWRGNETRVTCSGDVVRVLATNDKDIDIVQPVVMVGGLVCLALLTAGQAVPAMLGAGAIFAFASQQEPTSSKRDKVIVPLFRERDAIFQYLIDSFKAEGEVFPL